MTSGNVQKINFNQNAVQQTAMVIQQLNNRKENLKPKKLLSNEDRKMLKGGDADGHLLGMLMGDIVFAGAAALLFDENAIGLLGSTAKMMTPGFAEVASEVTEELIEDSFEKKQREWDKKKEEEMAEKRRMMDTEEKSKVGVRRERSMLEMIIIMLMLMMAMKMTADMMMDTQNVATSYDNDNNEEAAREFANNKEFVRKAANDATPNNFNRGFMPKLAM